MLFQMVCKDCSCWTAGGRLQSPSDEPKGPFNSYIYIMLNNCFLFTLFYVMLQPLLLKLSGGRSKLAINEFYLWDKAKQQE